MNVRRILVPLDGSRLAEAALPAARSLARTLGAKLLLLHVLEASPPAAVHGEPHLRTAGDARAYVEELAERLRRDGLDVELHVHEPGVDEVAGAICQHATEHRADLVAMCAHGKTNLRERLIGRTAARVVRNGTVPVLLRTVRRAQQPAFELRRVLVPLELGDDIGAALDAARTLAEPYRAAVTLLSVPESATPEAARLLPGTAALAQALDRAEIERRLDAVAGRLRADLAEVDVVVSDQRPAAAIVALSASLPADLVIVATDPDRPRPRWFEASTTDELLARPDLTLLLLKRVPGPRREA